MVVQTPGSFNTYQPIGQANGFRGLVEMYCDTTISFDWFQEGTMLMRLMHVASKQKPSRTGQLHSKKHCAAAVACL